MTRVALAGAFFLFASLAWGQSGADTALLREPALCAERLVFVYSGEIWVAAADGSDARRITADGARKLRPHCSPDGKWIAYSANQGGNIDVYVVAVEGGLPRRLTWHPDADLVAGWSPDSRRVLFVSPRTVGNSRSGQLYEVPVAGGNEHRVMKAVAVEGAWAPDGRRLAYRPYLKAYSGSSGWRQHRGGDTPPLWIIDPAGKDFEEIPHVNASDSNPLWIGDDLAFISDRADGAANLFLYESAGRSVRQLTHETVWDVRNAATDGRRIVYEAGGRLQALDLASGRVSPLHIHLDVDSPQAQPAWKDASRTITALALSPTGKRVLVTARGDVYSVPVKDGSVRNLTASSGVRESDALWSGDGQSLAYLSDEGGRQSLLVRDAAGAKAPRRHGLDGAGYYRLLAWSPDGRRAALDDSHLHLVVYDLEKERIERVDESAFRGDFHAVFSPDSQWLAYAVMRPNHLAQARLHGFAGGATVALADPLVHSDLPAFGANSLIYFAASTNAGPSANGLDMTTQEQPLRLGIYVTTLARDVHSPVELRTGDEDSPPLDAGAKKEDKKDEKAGAVAPIKVDLDGLGARAAPLPIAQRNYARLGVAGDGALFYLAQRQPGDQVDPPAKDAEEGASAELFRYSMEDRSEKSLLTGLLDFGLSGDGKKLLLREGRAKIEVGEAGEKPEAKPLALSEVRAFVDPRQEWKQIFDETWRLEREFFYDPKLHGLDWAAVRARYEALLPFVLRRDDLNELLVEMIGEFQVGHNRLYGGEVTTVHPSLVGLLGEDLEVDGDRLRVARILRGDRWRPFLSAPLARPELDIAEGDYLLAVNGRPFSSAVNAFALFDGTSGNQTTLTVSRDGSPKSAREVVVVPVGSERELRQWDWVERNLEYVQRRSQGRIAYVYLPDTASDGYAFFNRLFFAQSEKDALIVDDRRNNGGQVANYVLDVLGRKLLSGWKDRDGLPYNTPTAGIYGPKAMLIDQDAGSGGDYLPFGFHRLGFGPLIGTRTWGGIIGISANPDLIDGAELSVPFFRMYAPDRQWSVENQGVAPDIEVPLDPRAVNEGRDPQLDAAIDTLLRQLEAAPPRRNPPPDYPRELGQ